MKLENCIIRDGNVYKWIDVLDDPDPCGHCAFLYEEWGEFLCSEPCRHYTGQYGHFELMGKVKEIILEDKE